MKNPVKKTLVLGAASFLALLYFWPAPPKYSRDPPTTDGCSAPRTGFVVIQSKICLDLADSPFFDVRINPDDAKSDLGLIRRITWQDPELLVGKYGFPAATRRVVLSYGQITHVRDQFEVTASELPNLQRYETPIGEYVFTDGDRGFVLNCKPSFSGRQKELGAEYCDVSFQLDPFLAVTVSYGTFQWSGEPGWPVLDANWATKLAPVIQAARESVPALIEIQRK
ncbi:hypothetical protein K3729_11975 [Rhodobacteraceae bacterium S2214]|nr:hypothetical protein K3729_11975 [Rhodobacteraceae bacterium S2214]